MEFTILSNKEDMILAKNKQTNQYKLNFNISNNNIDLTKIVDDFKLWNLAFELNKQYVKDFIITKEYENSIDCLFIFENILKDYVKKSRYLYITITREKIDNKVIFITKKCIVPLEEKYNYVNKLTRIKHDEETLIFTLTDIHNGSVEKNFIVNLEEENLPIFAEDIVGIVIKKIFLSIKSFIEQLSI